MVNRLKYTKLKAEFHSHQNGNQKTYSSIDFAPAQNIQIKNMGDPDQAKFSVTVFNQVDEWIRNSMDRSCKRSVDNPRGHGIRNTCARWN